MDIISGMVARQGHPEFLPSELFDLWEENKKRLDHSIRGSENSGLIGLVELNEMGDLPVAESKSVDVSIAIQVIHPPTHTTSISIDTIEYVR